MNQNLSRHPEGLLIEPRGPGLWLTLDRPTVTELVDHFASLPQQGVIATKEVLRRHLDAGLADEFSRLGERQAELIASANLELH